MLWCGRITRACGRRAPPGTPRERGQNGDTTKDNKDRRGGGHHRGAHRTCGVAGCPPASYRLALRHSLHEERIRPAARFPRAHGFARRPTARGLTQHTGEKRHTKRPATLPSREARQEGPTRKTAPTRYNYQIGSYNEGDLAKSSKRHPRWNVFL